MDKKELVKIVNRQWAELKETHDKWKPEWQDVIDFVARKNIDLNQTKKQGDKPRALPQIYDTTALESAKMTRYGMQGYTCNQSLTWMKFKTEREEIMDLNGMRKWLGECETHIYSVLAKSNFYEAIGETIFDSNTLGTTLFYPEENEELSGVTFIVKDVSEFVIDENRKGEIDTVLRKFTVKLYRAVDQFDLPEELVRTVDNNPSREIVFIHAVFPSASRDYAKVGLDTKWKFSSVYIMEGNSEWCKVGGYNSNPYAVWRWEKRSGDPYGKSPALDSITDIKIINQMSKTMLRGAHKSVDPAYAVIGKSRVPDLNPGREVRVTSRDEVPVLINSTGPGYQLAVDQFNRVADRIRKQFHSDLFLMMEQAAGNNMTAREVIERQGEKAAVLGAIVSRMTSELFDPIIDRVWDIEMNANRLPQIPIELAQALAEAGQDASRIKIDYQGPLAQAQKKYHQTNGIQQILGTIIPMVQVRPDILDNFDLDGMLRTLAESDGVQADLVIDKEKVEMVRKQRAQMQQQQAQQQQQMMLAELAAKTGKAPEQGSPGDMVMQASGAKRPA
jgi:hypothetical protein